MDKYLLDFEALKSRLNQVSLPVCRGMATAAHPLYLDAELPGAQIGMRVRVDCHDAPPIIAEVAGFDQTRVTLLPLTRYEGVGAGAPVTVIDRRGHIPAGSGLLGRVIDPLGLPLDGGPALSDTCPWPLERAAPAPLSRQPVREQLETGIRVLDGCFGLGRGQRVGLFSGPGLGKSTLLGTLAERSTLDVNVLCLVGERGLEVARFIDEFLGPEGLSRTVVVLSRADDTLLNRVRALDAATAISEWFRQEGLEVLLLVDSLTRVLRAKRDAAFALGEPAVRGGFPASAFATLPTLIERVGRDHKAGITAIYAILTEGHDDDPVAEEARSLLDGHIILSRRLADRARWPAVDVLKSVSRAAESVLPPQILDRTHRLKALLGAYEENEDLILMGAYRRGTSAETDFALARKEQIDAFLMQRKNEASSLKETRAALVTLVDDFRSHAEKARTIDD